LLALVVVVALACLVVGCGAGSGGGTDSADSASHFTPAGYEALHEAVRFDDQLRRQHGLPLSVLKRQRTLCHHLGPTTDVEVEAVRSECFGSADQGAALIQLVSCKKLPVSTRRTCIADALQVLANGTKKFVAAENSVLQTLGKGRCYTFVHEGLPQDERLLVHTDEFLTAMTDRTVTQQVFRTWQAALEAASREQNADGRTADVKVKACRPS
jgi:hypothetical protein